MDAIKAKVKARIRRHLRVRKKVFGTPERPRLSVFRSTRHIYAQLIDDVAGRTIVSANTCEKQLRQQLPQGRGSNVEAAKLVGRLIAERALAKGYSSAVFDRGGYKYHGRVKAVAESAREAGLKI